MARLAFPGAFSRAQRECFFFSFSSLFLFFYLFFFLFFLLFSFLLLFSFFVFLILFLFSFLSFSLFFKRYRKRYVMRYISVTPCVTCNVTRCVTAAFHGTFSTPTNLGGKLIASPAFRSRLFSIPHWIHSALSIKKPPPDASGECKFSVNYLVPTQREHHFIFSFTIWNIKL